ncbi:hypothetical protein BD289DRAFT_478960 [Coniella lustricola]|uniref:Uncharacterized protein n=1 Tax=Coniella lustricola TaxID=2025994 RepID=A0A2T3AL05_9PEZI|nr:hypothetical protein BD289DRAFT_478960 [Coniella lustricola]
MAVRYELDFLIHLKDSPLCLKPKDLPPREDWMGPPPETARPQTKPATTERFKPEGALLESTTRRPGVDRHSSRNGTSEQSQQPLFYASSLLTQAQGVDGLTLGPPRTNFPSSTPRTNALADPERSERTPRDSEFRDRFSRGKIGSAGGDTDFRSSRNSSFRGVGRGEDRDPEGWSMVKPRKSFGQEGAERFTGRMGGDTRHNERGLKERDEHDPTKDRRRNFDSEVEEGDAPRKNGLNRARADPWFKESLAKPAETPERTSNRERIDKAKSWRVQDADDKSTSNPRPERVNDRHERRWDRDRDHRPAEREPEWLDEPLEERGAGHTEADLKKFMESMKAGKSGPKLDGAAGDTLEGSPGLPSFFSAEPPAVKSAPALEKGPDKFFAAFGEAHLAATSPDVSDKAETAKMPAVKSSRFANLFSSQTVEISAHTEPPTPAAVPPPLNGGLLELQQSDADKQAFAALLSKLQHPRLGEQHGTPTPPTLGGYSQPPSVQSQKPAHDPIRELNQTLAQKAHITSPEPVIPYGMGRGEEPRLRSVPPGGPEIMAPRPVLPPSQPPSTRPDQMLQDLVNQRHNAQSQGSGRPDYSSEPQAAFLMQLMQNRIPQDPRPIEQIMRHPQPQRQTSIPHFQDREPDFMRDRMPNQMQSHMSNQIPGQIPNQLPNQMPNQQRQMRPPAPPVVGFAEEQFRRADDPTRLMQPPQILQRQGMAPPGLEGMPGQQPLWHGQQGPPGGQRQPPMILPPGFQGGQRPPTGPMPPGPFNLGAMPPVMFSPPDVMPGGQRVQPPPGFFPGGPPPGPGFMPPTSPGMAGGFPGPEGMMFPNPFDGRGGMPPPGAAPFRR